MDLLTASMQWIGCVTGICGSALLALNNRFSGWGFVLFLISNIFWIAFSLITSTNGLLTMQIFYMVTSIVGVIRWLKPSNSIRTFI